jgi:uncharacterized protein (TIGR02391 family)
LIDSYLKAKKLIRAIGNRSQSALDSAKRNNAEEVARLKETMFEDLQQLELIITNELSAPPSTVDIRRHLRFGQEKDFGDILHRDLPRLEGQIDAILGEFGCRVGDLGIEHLLDPIIIANAYPQFQNGHLRDAVLNSIIAIFDLIKSKTGLHEDGFNLAAKAFSLHAPKLILSEVETESGENDQKGFMLLVQGAAVGIRNPKAHSLAHDLTPEKTAQYLVFASLLARRINESKIAE